LAAIPSGLGQGFQSAVGADQGLGQTMTDIGAGGQGPAPTAGQVQFPGTPTELTLPETGSPEGERITSALAETAARETPGGGLAGEALRRLGGAYRSPLLRADAL